MPELRVLADLYETFFPIALVHRRVIARDKILNFACDSQYHFTGNS
jgi:hypothetical protein